jgi:hypothetical protein
VKNLGFLLDLVAILLVGNKVTYINEQIKFQHFKECDGPSFCNVIGEKEAMMPLL